MSVRRRPGSEHSIRHAAGTGTSGIVALRRDADVRTPDPVQPQPARGGTWSGRDEPYPQDTAAGLLGHDVAAGRPPSGGLRFARLHAALAERQLDWAWQNCADAEGPPDDTRRSGARRADAGLAARALWLGGIAFALLAAGIISAVAALQSSRPLPFETWARADLTRRADGMPGATPTDGMAVALAMAPTAAERDPGEVDAALGPHVRLEPSDLEIAGLGPILASAAGAEELAANLPAPPVQAAPVGSRAERLPPGPPRPVFKPMLSSSYGEPEEAVPSKP